MKLNFGIFMLAVFFISACGGGDSSPDPVPDPDPVPSPLAATLVFPDNNAECNEGVVLNGTQSKVTFEWNASQNTDSYEVNLRNLNSNSSSKSNSNTNSAEITLERGVPYEWFVISKANGTNATATSSIWKFYNQGPGIENYAPFPAEAVNPGRGAAIDNSGTVQLEWTGSDVDNDIIEYEVLFGTDSEPSDLLGTTPDSFIDATIATGVYYWRVISRDSQGNSSQSEIFEFSVL
jgi:hypothetical protein